MRFVFNIGREQKTLLTAAEIRRKKRLIFGFGVAIYFLSCMGKVLVPGTIFQALQCESGMNPEQISALGAAFMYAYAASQLATGIFADRYGGVRILLIGGALFGFGMLEFPVSGCFAPMLGCRILAGFGAGTVFLGVTKLAADLFPDRFTVMLSMVLLLGAFGPTFGTAPMAGLVSAIGWRTAMAMPGAIAAAAWLGICGLSGGMIRRTASGQTLAPLGRMLHNRRMWQWCLTVAVIFGAYYVVAAQIGQMSLVDCHGMSATGAATWIMMLTIVVALGSPGINALMKLTGDRRKRVAVAASLCSFAGCLLGGLAFWGGWSSGWVFAAFLLIAIPAGFFSLYGTVAKELNPPEDTALSVALLNFWSFICIAGFQNAVGAILRYNSHDVPGATGFSAEAYAGIFLLLAVAALAGLWCLRSIPETNPRNP